MNKAITHKDSLNVIIFSGFSGTNMKIAAIASIIDVVVNEILNRKYDWKTIKNKEWTSIAILKDFPDINRTAIALDAMN